MSVGSVPGLSSGLSSYQSHQAPIGLNTFPMFIGGFKTHVNSNYGYVNDFNDLLLVSPFRIRFKYFVTWLICYLATELKGVATLTLMDLPVVSYHYRILFSYDITLSSSEPNTYFIQSFKKANIGKIAPAILDYLWSEFFNLTSLDDLSEFFNNVICLLFVQYVPLKKRLVPKRPYHPGFQPKIKCK